MSPTKKSCGVVSCKNGYVQGSDSSNLAFHSFPKDEEGRKSWTIACMNPKITTKNGKCKTSFVCGKHFSNDCYPFLGTKVKRLKKGSKPTKYLPTLGKNVYLNNEIVGRIVNVESVANEEAVTNEEPITNEEPVTVQSKAFSSEFEALKPPNFKNNEPVEVCLKTITENVQIIDKEMENYVFSTMDNKAQLLEKQLTRNLLAAQVISTSGYWEENRKCIMKTIRTHIEKLQKDKHDFLENIKNEMLASINLEPGTSKVPQQVREPPSRNNPSNLSTHEY